jgi:hypothetical protein
MGPESWSLLVAAGTFVVITASAYAALAQLRHLNTTNQLSLERKVASRQAHVHFQIVDRFVEYDL